MAKTNSTRRVVTGHDARGKAVVRSDGPCPVEHTNPDRPGYHISSVWATAASPRIGAEDPDPTFGPHRLPPPPQGTVFRVTTFPPDTLRTADAAKARAIFAAMGGEHVLTSKRRQPHALMHRTESIDYAIVLDGEIVLVLDDTEVALKAGDVVVQRGTNHAWSNRSDAPCRMAFVLVDARFDANLEAAIRSYDDAPGD
jgi:hypothetical protein